MMAKTTKKKVVAEAKKVLAQRKEARPSIEKVDDTQVAVNLAVQIIAINKRTELFVAYALGMSNTSHITEKFLVKRQTFGYRWLGVTGHIAGHT